MKIALAQMQMSNDIESNYQKSIKLIREAAEKRAQLVMFPEIQLTPFFPQYKGMEVSAYVLTFEHQYIKGMCEACRECGIYASPNFYIEDNGKRYDMSLIIDDEGNIVGKQKMVHIAECDQFYEQDYYTPSEEGFTVFDTKIGKIGIVVCFDRHYPESIRTESLRGAELILIPTANTTSEPSELFEWEIRVQAFQNSVNIAMCNRCGKEDGMIFSGKSIVSDYNGNLIAVAGDKEELFIAEVDLSDTEKIRHDKPYTCFRRKNLYE